MPAASASTSHSLRTQIAYGANLLNACTTPRLDAELLLAHVIQRPRTALFAHPDDVLSDNQLRHYHELLAQRVAGKPLAYITGEREFWSRTFEVTEATLIPRPETELLVERALNHLPSEQKHSLLDLGTGTGIIAITLACERPQLTVTATDASPAAVTVAKANAATHCNDRIVFIQSDWFAALTKQKYNLIVSNPPYVAAADTCLQHGETSFEPRSALAAGEAGLDDLTKIISTAPTFLNRHGWLLLEHGTAQADAVQSLLTAAGFERIQTHRDLAGHDRVTEAQWLK
ncbi:MAG: peptide chain release factor N(5)-glutamine methyltransferase [Gammaproteobacteria bacterium]